MDNGNIVAQRVNKNVALRVNLHFLHVQRVSLPVWI